MPARTLPLSIKHSLCAFQQNMKRINVDIIHSQNQLDGRDLHCAMFVEAKSEILHSEAEQ